MHIGRTENFGPNSTPHKEIRPEQNVLNTTKQKIFSFNIYAAEHPDSLKKIHNHVILTYL